MATEYFADPILIDWHRDQYTGKKRNIPRLGEPHSVVNGRIVLDYVPEIFNRVQLHLTYDPNFILAERLDTQTVDTVNEFRVDYTTGLIYVHPDLEAYEITADYYSRGVVMYPASRIYTTATDKIPTGTMQEAIDVINIVDENLVHLGDYSDTATYKFRNMVSYLGSSYMCIEETTGYAPTDTVYWQLIAQRGSNLAYRGNYSAGTAYAVNDIVSYNSATYVCKLISTGNLPTNSTYWNIFLDISNEVYNPSYSTTQTTSKPVTSLAGTVIKGQLKGTLKGNTYYNLLENAGDFNSVATWPLMSVDYTNRLFGDACGKLDNIAGIAEKISENTTKIYGSGKYLFLSFYAKCATGTPNIEFFLLGYNVSNVMTSSNLANQAWNASTTWTRYMLKVDLSAKTEAYWKFRVDINSYGNSTCVAYYDGAMAVEITQNEYNTLTTTQLGDKYPFINGIKSTDKQRVKVTGKNLFNVYAKPFIQSGNVNFKVDSSGMITSDMTSAEPWASIYYQIRLKPNTSYTLSRFLTKIIAGSGGAIAVGNLDSQSVGFATCTTGSGNQNLTFTSPTNGIVYLRFFVSDSVSEVGSMQWSNIQLEEGSSVTAYEPYKESTSIIPIDLKGIPNATYYDTFDINTGVNTKFLSDWYNLDGVSNAWTTAPTFKYSGFKRVLLGGFSNMTMLSYPNYLLLKYNGMRIDTNIGSWTSGDQSYAYQGNVVVTINNGESGWDDTWDTGTTFIGMTISGLIKAYMNGWKLTIGATPTDVATGSWKGIASGATQSGSAGYTYVQANKDSGYQPYRVIYQLDTPIIRNYLPSIVESEPYGNIITEPFVNDVGYYIGSGITVENSAYPIGLNVGGLLYVNKINTQTGLLTPLNIANTVTVAPNGLSFTILGAVQGEYYDYGYWYYNPSSTVGTLDYIYNTNLKAQVNSNSEMVKVLDSKINDVYALANSKVQVVGVPLGAVSATYGQVIFVAPANCILTRIQLVSFAAVAQSDTNYWTIAIGDRGSTGVSYNVVATKNTKTTGGYAIASYDAWDMGTLDATNSVLVQGDVVSITLTKTGTPTAFAESFVSLEYQTL